MAKSMVNDPKYYVQIDGDKIKAYLKKKKIGSVEMSGRLRRNESFITQSCARGSMRKREYEFLVDELGVDYDYFRTDLNETEETVETETTTTDLSEAVTELRKLNESANNAEIVAELRKLNDNIENVGRVLLAMLEKF